MQAPGTRGEGGGKEGPPDAMRAQRQNRTADQTDKYGTGLSDDSHMPASRYKQRMALSGCMWECGQADHSIKTQESAAHKLPFVMRHVEGRHVNEACPRWQERRDSPGAPETPKVGSHALGQQSKGRLNSFQFS